MREVIEQLLRKSVGKTTIFPEVTVPDGESFGHYATSVAFKLAKERGISPRECAEKIIEVFQKKAPKALFSKIELAGPGFINFWFSSQFLQKELVRIYRSRKTYGRSKIGKGERMIVDYSQPNIAKKMHVGHLRSTIIGDAIANICEMAGYRVVRWNYLGDWGTQFGKLIAAYKLWGVKSEVLRDPIATLLALYVRFHDEAKINSELEARGALEFKKLEDGDKENRKLWKWFRDASLIEFKRMYNLLGVEFDNWIGESAYEKQLQSLVGELLKKGIAEKSEGAIVVKLEPQGLPPALIQKSDGASLYLTRDIALLKDRVKKYKTKRIVYVVDNGQSLHFEQLFAVAELLGIRARPMHAKFGLMLGEDGKKLSTREGKAIDLYELIQKLIVLARAAVEKKNSALSLKEKDRIARVVAIGALKYNDLKENRMSDVVFDWERMLDFSGNSGPYLQYTYARLRRIVKKAKKIGAADLKLLTEPTEIALMKKLLDFPDEIVHASETLFTNGLANYLYELAWLGSRYYETTPILKDENKKRLNARLMLLESVSSTLKNGLGLLGIETLEEI